MPKKRASRKAAKKRASRSKKPAARKPTAKEARDIERTYPAKQFVSKLRRLADAIEGGRPFRIQVGGERVAVPADAMISVEHERSGEVEEVELQFRWTNG